MTQHTTTLAAFASAASEAPAGVAAATVLAELALTQRELLAARQLIRLLCETLRERGEHPTSCERGIIAGHECACGLDLAIALAVDSGAVPELAALGGPAPELAAGRSEVGS